MVKSPEPSSPVILRVLIGGCPQGSLQSARLPAPTPTWGSPHGPRATLPTESLQETRAPSAHRSLPRTIPPTHWGPRLPPLHQDSGTQILRA